MMFKVAARSYDRFMGRYSAPLAPMFADFAGVAEGQRALDVGCGPGALTGELAHRLGPRQVSAIDPSESFVTANRERNPGVDVRTARAEEIPFEAATFDVVMAQLVVHFMADPVAGIGEMRRVARAGGTVAACVWDHGGGGGPLGAFWDAARSIDPHARNESELPGAREGHLVELFADSGLVGAEGTALVVEVRHEDFESWWEPFTLGVGPAGAYVASLDPPGRDALRRACRDTLGDGPFTVSARAWAARGRA